ncbi:hypothetical protein CWATWH0402_4068 [Crocosphaera watsonii WH 0402]|uniref:Uncharacterized protein n=1 Tax=Crocosphaera watsonii WH 0402 TaxID=1284629 RepID=T2JUB7_CROWT|nr:hypothetical protein CWATWH0402_4068 [Crocosphaera watsonii WH 0402]
MRPLKPILNSIDRFLATTVLELLPDELAGQSITITMVLFTLK